MNFWFFLEVPTGHIPVSMWATAEVVHWKVMDA